MAGRTISVTGYTVILFVLLGLTATTVGVSFLPLSGLWHLAAGWAIAVGKATLVLLFFMHVLSSRAATLSTIVVSLVLLAILFSLTLSDHLTRSWLPFAPGH